MFPSELTVGIIHTICFISWLIELIKNLYDLESTDFPYDLPAGVEHYILWTRVSAITREAFAPRDGEAVPDHSFNDPSRVEALIRYVEHYDFYGWYGIHDEDVENSFALSSFAHATNPVWHDPESDHTVTREQGAAVMKWLGRHVAAAIQPHFPEDEFQVLFNRSPARWKYVHVSPFFPKQTSVPDLSLLLGFQKRR